MVQRLIKLALHHPWIVLAATATIVALGIYSYQNEKIDAYPDISGQMVQILTSFPGRAPEEVEQQVTIPIEFTMGNVPRVTTIRSRTIFGLSVVQLSFEDAPVGAAFSTTVADNDGSTSSGACGVERHQISPCLSSTRAAE